MRMHVPSCANVFSFTRTLNSIKAQLNFRYGFVTINLNLEHLLNYLDFQLVTNSVWYIREKHPKTSNATLQAYNISYHSMYCLMSVSPVSPSLLVPCPCSKDVSPLSKDEWKKYAWMNIAHRFFLSLNNFSQ